MAGDIADIGLGNGCKAAGGNGDTEGGTAETGTPYTYFSKLACACSACSAAKFVFCAIAIACAAACFAAAAAAFDAATAFKPIAPEIVKS
eukprot:CAMPEP_0169266786 /NCGR_PEP_ID=MMETSP1016-20121227/46665_1 /TAXON_ID=342587 /ORGANISM="Karlodinium micrum, Strain CCMP2283" /LENGTH=89 /DNA_ID=CAMNT_0009350879 /DNA_START=68 /DNA_END=334 /DNA_ORIENTATION=+